MVKVKDPVTLAIVSLILGSVATPLLYVASAWLLPQGFADLRQASAQTVLYYFAIIWLASALLTAIVGGITWRLLHSRNWDSFTAYALVGAAVAIALGVVTGAGVQNWMAIVMAASNGLAVRGTEIALR